jgi:hypothetical protein
MAKITKKEQQMLDSIAKTYGKDAAEALASLILTSKKVKATS